MRALPGRHSCRLPNLLFSSTIATIPATPAAKFSSSPRARWRPGTKPSTQCRKSPASALYCPGWQRCPPRAASRKQNGSGWPANYRLSPSPIVTGSKYSRRPEQLIGPIRNSENPELYAVFPYHLYGVGKPSLPLARRTFDQRRVKGTGGWYPDAILAACLGLADTAALFTAQNFSSVNHGSRFPAFWGPNFDWVPDQDNGSVAMIALESMLLQTDGRRIFVLPAWPSGWDVNFKLHAPGNTTVEGIYRHGRVERLDVRPAARKADVTIISKQ